MALNLSGFTTPEQQFGGLYKMGDTLERNRSRKEHEAQYDAANRNSMSKFLTDYLDPKEHLSGSPYDPEITKGYMDLLSEGADLIKNNKGITNDMLLAALSPKVNRLSQYGATAKSIQQQIKTDIANAGTGYDKLALEQEAKKSAFYNDDGSKKDISEVDPNVNWLGYVVQNKPELVTNNKGIDEWLSKQQKVGNSTEVINIGSKGGRDRKKVKTSAYDWVVPSVDESGVNDRTFEPKYSYAYDADTPILHDGKKVKIIDDGIYKKILSNSPETANWLRGQVNLAFKSGEYKDANGKPMSINSPHADMLAKALLFRELKDRGLGGMEDIVEHKENPIKIYTGGGGSKPTEKEKSRAESASNLFKTLDDIKPNEKGDLDVTDLFAGINILSPITKKPLKPEFTGYNPKTKVFTFMSDGVEEKIPYHKMYSLAATANSGIDKDWFSSFEKYSRSEGAKNEPAKPKEEKKGILGNMMNWMKKGNEASREKQKSKKNPLGLDL